MSLPGRAVAGPVLLTCTSAPESPRAEPDGLASSNSATTPATRSARSSRPDHEAPRRCGESGNDFPPHAFDQRSQRLDSRSLVERLQEWPAPVRWRAARQARPYDSISAGANTGTSGCTGRAQIKGVLDAYYLSADGVGD